jgi:putative methionine-R-sulfoxide reductase with GAF domain
MKNRKDLTSIFPKMKQNCTKHEEYDFLLREVLEQIIIVSCENLFLDEQFERIFDILFTLPWLAYESKGCIYLMDSESHALVMKAQRGLTDTMRQWCDRLPLGKCLCGQAALEARIVFSSTRDSSHIFCALDFSYHGHYCVPLISDKKMLGVMNIFIKEGHKRNLKEEKFLSLAAEAIASMLERRKKMMSSLLSTI